MTAKDGDQWCPLALLLDRERTEGRTLLQKRRLLDGEKIY